MKHFILSIALMFAGACCLQAQDVDTQTDVPVVSEEEMVYDEPDTLPEYPGGDRALLRFLAENLKYPVEAMEDNIQGKVVVKFVVNKKGDVENVHVIEGVDPSLDKEAVRVAKKLYGFKPGKKDGAAVKTWFTLPIVFRYRYNPNF